MSTLLDACNSQITEHIAKSVEYKNQIDSAKTKIKRKILTKRLKKNNEHVLELLKVVESLTNKDDSND